MSQLVDPAVSRVKFDRELRNLRRRDTSYARRGWLLLKAEFPHIEIAFLAMNTQPSMIVAAVRFDFTDFDLHPLSVRFIDHRTGAVLQREGLSFWMKILADGMPIEMGMMLAAQGKADQLPDMIQGYPGQPAFLCLPGVREYHDHVSHSGDPWELHRESGEGAMLQIVEKIWQFGANPMNQIRMQVSMVPQPGLAIQ